MSKLHHYYTGIYNRFGYSKLIVQVEAGTMDGELVEHKYYLMNKKVYSKRFSTDCYSDFFMEKTLTSEVGTEEVDEFSFFDD